MSEAFIIGLPKGIRPKVEGRAKSAGAVVSSILCGLGKEGRPILLPHPSDAIHHLRSYIDRVDSPNIVVLSYAPLPVEVAIELGAVADLYGGGVRIVDSQESNWPRFSRKSGFNQKFLNELFDALEIALFGSKKVVLPSEHLQLLSAETPRLIIANGALDSCEEVAHFRRSFIINSANALRDLCARNGMVGPLSEYFSSRGLDFASTGGSTTKLEVFRGNERLYYESSNYHLKQGDSTTPQAAARVYFQAFSLGGDYYVVVLYCGPHPKGDFSNVVEF